MSSHPRNKLPAIVPRQRINFAQIQSPMVRYASEVSPSIRPSYQMPMEVFHTTQDVRANNVVSVQHELLEIGKPLARSRRLFPLASSVAKAKNEVTKLRQLLSRNSKVESRNYESALSNYRGPLS